MENRIRSQVELAKLALEISRVNPKGKLWINETEFSRLVDISLNTIRRWRWDGKGQRFYKFGRHVRYDYFEAQEFLSNSARTSTTVKKDW